MIDPEVRRLAQARIRPRMEERRRVLPRQIEVIKNNMTVRGHGSSGALTQAIQDACEQEAAARVTLAWTELKTVLAATGVSFTEDLAGELKAEVGRHVDSSDLVAIVNSAAGDDHALRGAVDRALQMTGSDIDLYTVNLKRVAEQQGRTGQPIYNFLGPVGAVQTGPHSTANVVQRFGVEDRQALIRALDELRARVVALEASAMPQKAEVVELIDEAREEVVKERPNRLRLASVLSGVGTSIQTVGAADAAYRTLKAAATMIGITLP